MSLAIILSVNRTKLATTASIVLVLIGLFTNDFLPELPSIGIMCLLLVAILHVAAHQRIVQKKQWHVYSAFTGVFFLHLLAGFNTSEANREAFWIDVLQQLPFLVLPIAFWLLPPLSSQTLRLLYLVFFYLVVVSAIGSTGYYLMHAAEINQLYYQSQIMPTIPDYIRFSLMVTLAIAIGTLFLFNNVVLGRNRVLVLLATTFLVLYLYLLSVRSGLVAFNVLGVAALIWLLIRHKYSQAFGLGGVLLMLPWLSFLCFPTFHNKYYNTQDDVSRVEKVGSANNFSLVGRVYSYKVGLQLAQAHPWVGVGKADMEDEIAAYYKADFPDIEPSAYLLPHNQFLYYLVAFGAIGLLTFMGCFYYPIYWEWTKSGPIMIAQYIIISLSFLVEYTLDQKSQVGLLFALIFLLLSLNGLMSPTRSERGWRPS
ncbi:O-antigen ligase family protein [Hymenobacter sp. HD11105]